GIIFDSDVRSNNDVRVARRALHRHLKELNARPSLIEIPSLNGSNKTGADDYLAVSGPDAMLALIGKSFPMHGPPRQAMGNGTVLPLAAIIAQIVDLLRLYISWPTPAIPTLIAVWTVGTYCFEVFRYFGYLALRSATPRCGKSRTLRLLCRVIAGEPTI